MKKTQINEYKMKMEETTQMSQVTEMKGKTVGVGVRKNQLKEK